MKDSLLERLEQQLEVQNSLLAEIRDLMKEEVGLMIDRRDRGEK